MQEILITKQQLEAKISELANQITKDYQGEELILVSILKGSVIFLSDLMKQFDLDVEIGFLYLSSYRGETSPQSEVQEYILPFPRIENRHVLIVEDILDTGSSVVYAIDKCRELQPRSVKTCILLVKDGIERIGNPEPDYYGFHIPNKFVVGYGLDYQEKYRQLPYIGIPCLEMPSE